MAAPYEHCLYCRHYPSHKNSINNSSANLKGRCSLWHIEVHSSSSCSGFSYAKDLDEQETTKH